MSKNNIINIIKKVTQKTLDMLFRYPEQDITMFNQDAYRWGNWDWGTGVALYGIIQANKILKDQEVILKIKEWIDARIHNTSRKICINTTSPLLSVLYLNKLHHELKYENLCKKYDNYLINKIYRGSTGAISHTTVKKENPGQIWTDTLFMSIIYLSQRGVFLNDQKLLKEALNQLYIHIKILFDEPSALFFHGWDDNKKKNIGVKWGRGNAWVTASIIDILKNINENSPEKIEILSILDKHLSKVEKLQDKEGFWKTVMDVETTYQETTVTAGIAYGVLKGNRLGIISLKYQKMAIKALGALLSKIDPDGLLQCASGGTPVKEDAQAYNNIPYKITPYAQGLALLALSEANNYIK